MKRMYSFALFVVLMVCTFSLKATEQIPDYIIHEGKKYRLETGWGHPSPLEVFYIRTAQEMPFHPYSTANYRGHVATWEIRDSMLYLLNVNTKIVEGYTGTVLNTAKNKRIDTIVEPTFFSINSLNGQPVEADGAVFADWFSGVLTIDNRGADAKWDDEFKGIRYIYVRNGKVIDDQLLVKEDFERINNFTLKDTADHELMDKYRLGYLNQCYLSYWFQDAQVEDVLFYDGKEAKIVNNSSLIAKLYNNNPLEYPFSWENFELNGSPLASYSISGDSMFLTNVIVCSGLDFYERNEDSVSLSALFDEKNIENGKVFANWIDGDIYLKYGKTMYSDFGSERFFVERMQKIVLDSGRVVGMEWTPCDFNSDIVSNPVSVCDTSKIYVSQSNILEYYADSLQPKTLPYWADGDSVLEAWFETQTIDDERKFRWNVAFVVNCKGEVGGWTLISPSGSVFDDYEVIEMRDALFDILSKLPNKWVPATDENGNPVDCRMAFDIRLVDKKLKGEIDEW